MDREPAEGSPSPSTESKHRARKRPWDDSDENLPSLESSETPSRSPTQPDSPLPGSDVEGATSSRVLSLPEEFYKTLEKDGCADSQSSVEDSVSADDCTDPDSFVKDSSFADECTDSEGSDERSSSSSTNKSTTKLVFF